MVVAASDSQNNTSPNAAELPGFLSSWSAAELLGETSCFCEHFISSNVVVSRGIMWGVNYQINLAQYEDSDREQEAGLSVLRCVKERIMGEKTTCWWHLHHVWMVQPSTCSSTACLDKLTQGWPCLQVNLIIYLKPALFTVAFSLGECSLLIGIGLYLTSVLAQ